MKRSNIFIQNSISKIYRTRVWLFTGFKEKVLVGNLIPAFQYSYTYTNYVSSFIGNYQKDQT